MERSKWPIHLVDEEEVRAWIASTLPDVSAVEGPIKIEQVKSWGVVARFRVLSQGGDAQEVIFKASHLPLFTYGPVVDQRLMRYCPEHVPVLLGSQRWADKAWMLYQPFAGTRVSAQLSEATLCQIAVTFTQVQSRITQAPTSDFAAIPRTSIAALPAQFAAVVQEIEERQWPIWHNDERWLLTEFQIPDDLIPRLKAFSTQFAHWAAELAAMRWPDTIEHADLQADNAAFAQGGTMILFDWEEATLGCPFLSLYRLLDDARTLDIQAGRTAIIYDGRYAPSELAVRQAYIEALPWQTLSERGRAFDLAMCLAPVRAIHDGMVFAAAQGWAKGIPPQVAMLSTQALLRWEAFARR